jgi:nitrogen fixation protein NifZ
MTVAQQKYLSSSTKDEILPEFNIGQKVKLVRDIKNDGTYPFAPVGDVLLKAGAEGYVRHIGDFLQTIRVYEVNFFEAGIALGCRGFELEAMDEVEDEVAKELEWLREHRAKKAKQKKGE